MKRNLKILTIVSFIFMSGTTDNWLVQIIWSVFWLMVFLYSVSELENYNQI